MFSISFAVLEQRARGRRLLLAPDQVGLGDALGLHDLVQEITHVTRQDDVLDADLAYLGAGRGGASGDVRANLGVDGVTRSQNLIERARRDGLADGELDQPV